MFLSSQSATPHATSSYGRTKLEAERRLLETEGIRIVNLRPGLVTGPGAGGLFQRVSSTVERLPIVPLLGGGRAIVQPIHVDDLCGAILACDGLSEELDHMVLCLGDPHGISLSELVHRSRSRGSGDGSQPCRSRLLRWSSWCEAPKSFGSPFR